jgi:hypothetical protein
VHASWLNQVQIYFSIRRRKAISSHDFADLDQLSERFPSFHRYNKTATPFDRTYTCNDPNAYLHRLDAHDTTHARPDAGVTPDELATMTTSERMCYHSKRFPLRHAHWPPPLCCRTPSPHSSLSAVK